MKDLTHDHLTFGFKPGCPGCEQYLADLRNMGCTSVPEEVVLQLAAS